jgi:hypothetical protein
MVVAAAAVMVLLEEILGEADYLAAEAVQR